MKVVSKEDIDQVLKFILQSKDANDNLPLLKGDRVQYSCILSFIQKLDSEQKMHLKSNAEKFRNTLEDNNDQNVSMFKLLDYIELEVPRLSLFQELKDQAMKSQVAQRSLRAQIRSKDELLQKYEDKIGKLQTEFISILSIFSTVVLAFFGGLSILGSSLDNINKVSKYRITFIVLIIVFAIFNVIFMLLHIVSKLVDTKITTECNRNDICKDCDKNIKILKCLRYRYPIVFWFDSICLAFIVTDFIMYVIDNYNIITYVCKLKPVIDYSKVGLYGLKVLVGIIVIMFILSQRDKIIGFIKSKARSTKSKFRNKQNKGNMHVIGIKKGESGKGVDDRNMPNL